MHMMIVDLSWFGFREKNWLWRLVFLWLCWMMFLRFVLSLLIDIFFLQNHPAPYSSSKILQDFSIRILCLNRSFPPKFLCIYPRFDLSCVRFSGLKKNIAALHFVQLLEADCLPLFSLSIKLVCVQPYILFNYWDSLQCQTALIKCKFLRHKKQSRMVKHVFIGISPRWSSFWASE